MSNPCFELWLILHFQDRTAWLDTAEACRLRQRLDRSTDKGIEAAQYIPLTAVAARRAARLDERHQQNYRPHRHGARSLVRKAMAALRGGSS